MSAKRNKSLTEDQSKKASTGLIDPPNILSIYNLALAVLIATITLFVYFRVDDHQFVNWDDQVYISENPLMLDAKHTGLWKTVVSNNYHPITMKSLALQYHGTNTKAPAFIKLNIGIHIINTFLIFLFFHLLTRGKSWLAFFTSLLFAIHPMHVESIVWVSERKDVLYLFFGFMSCITYLKFIRTKHKVWLFTSFAAFVLACGSKAMAVVFPVLLILIDYFEEKPIFHLKNHFIKLPFYFIALLTGLIALDVQSGGSFYGILSNQEVSNSLGTSTAFTMFEKIKFASYGLGQYCLKLIYPFKMAAFHPYPSGIESEGWIYTASPGIFLVYLIVCLWAYFRNKKILFFGLAWMLCSLILVLQFIAVGSAIMADRYTYLAYIGITFSILFLLYNKVGSNRLYFYILSSFLAIYSVFLITITVKQIKTWKDSISLWDNVIKNYPNDAKSYALRGTSWGKYKNDLTKAKADFEKAIAIDQNCAMAYEGLGIIAGMQNDKTKALEMLIKCQTLDANNSNYAYNLGVAYIENKRPIEAVPLIEKAIALNPSKKQIFFPNYINALVQVPEFSAKTKSMIAEAKQMGLIDELIAVSTAQLYIREKNKPKAVEALKEVLSINPKNESARLTLSQLEILVE